MFDAIIQPHVNSPLGLVHTAAAAVALITGSVVLLASKGTIFHRSVGYAYVFSMVLVLGTAFGIYDLFGGFGLFHAFALLGTVALVGGMYPVLFRAQVRDWRVQHLEVMSWSVVGLYAAFAAEFSVRVLPHPHGLWALGIAGGLVTTVGGTLIRRRKRAEIQRLSRGVEADRTSDSG